MQIKIISTTFLELSTDWIPITLIVPTNSYEVLFLIQDKSTGISRCGVSTYSDMGNIKSAYEKVTHWREIPY